MPGPAGRQPAGAAQESARPAGLLAKLVAAVRAEFRRDDLAFDACNPVFGGPACRVPTCPRPGRTLGMCHAHYQRWIKAGKPGAEEFATATAPHFRRPPPSCRVAGCGNGVAGAGLCPQHRSGWRRAGQPELAAWLAGHPPATPASPPPVCPVPGCGLWVQGGTPYCHAHGRSWVRLGRPDPAEFLRSQRVGGTPPLPAYERVDLRGLPAQLRLEVQYALQCRHDEQAAQTRPSTARAAVRFLVDSQVGSLLDWPEQEWELRLAASGPKNATPATLVTYARRQVEDLAFGRGWEVEYPRDVWRLRNLGLDAGHDPHATARFDRIPQPWLKDLAKRWVRLRISTGASASWAYRCAATLTRFAVFLATAGVEQLAGVDRAVLERYLAHLRTGPAGSGHRHNQVGLLNGFLCAIRQHGWDDTLPASAVFVPEDYPRRGVRLPRALAEHVMAQVEHPANLDRWGDPARKLATVILMRCGLRVSDALGLPFDCVARDSDGAPYLRYYNHKMRREALVPIDAELQQLIAEQQRRVLQQWPGGTPVLLPRPKMNADGSRPISSNVYRDALYRWLHDCDIRDEHGRPAHLTPHQWRHTLGTRMINRDVPQEVVRRILDHDSPTMTAHYARLHDTTVRRHWEQARKVNVNGEAVTLDPDGPLAEAAWAKQRLSRATQALPNGYCGLPVQQSCPHANACLTCPTFITTAEFLSQHRRQHQQTLQIISAAEARGQQRLAEMNRHVAGNLKKIITALECDGGQEAVAGAS